MQLFKDARYFQILFQSIFLSYGIFFLHWQNEVWLYSIYFSTSIVVFLFCEFILVKQNISFATNIIYKFLVSHASKFQSGQPELVEGGYIMNDRVRQAHPDNIKKQNYIFDWYKIKNGIPSVLISSFGLSLLLKTNHWQSAVFAASISILSKYLCRVNGKHIFNPSALGIVATIFICQDCWISPGQWGSSFVLLFAVSCFGFIVLTKVQKLTVSTTFLGAFIGLLFIRQIIYLGWPMDYLLQSISTGSLLLFSFFMITDPKTLPNNITVRNIWVMAIACIAFYFSTFRFVNGSPIFTLVFAQLFVPFLDRLFTAKKFEWEYQKPFSEYSIKNLAQNQITNKN